MEILIKEIAALETYPVRHPVLRTKRPIETCRFEGDDLETTKHYGLFVKEKLVGVTTLMQSSNDLFENKHQFQMRGMAILSHYQGQGLGAHLIREIEKNMKNHESVVLWFHARLTAVPFYEKMGFEIKGNSFEIPEIGTHFVMFKNLKNSQ